MTALLEIHLSEGLTPDEIGAFIEIAKEREASVESVILEALRERARKFRSRRRKGEPETAAA